MNFVTNFLLPNFITNSDINMKIIEDNYLNGLISLKEDDFTSIILKPLFESMGYDRVDFHGGANEKGKDLIAQYHIPPRREKRITFVQSKKVGNIQNAKTGAKLSELLHQLRQCCTDKLFTIDGVALAADDVYLACPEKISTRLVEKIYAEIAYSKDKIRIYDGPQIIEDIKIYKPELLEKLTTIKDKLTTTCNNELINSELLNALKCNNNPTLDNFYSDLSFFVGSIDSNHLLHMDIESINEKISIHKDDWIQAKKDINYLQLQYGLTINLDDISKIENIYHGHRDKYESEANKRNIDRFNELNTEINDIDNCIKNSLDAINALLQQPQQTTKNNIDDKTKAIIQEYLKYIRATHQSEFQIEDLKINENIPPHLKFDIEKIIVAHKTQTKKKFDANQILSKIAKDPQYTLQINIENIKNKFLQCKQHYKNNVPLINAKSLSISEIEKFLSETEKNLNLISRVNDKTFILHKILSLKLNRDINDRVSISPHTIFDTGFDIALYGGAGVGKTTTLQAYASKITSRTILYLPLNRILQKINSILREHKDRKFLKTDMVWKSILISKDIQPTEEYIEQANELLSDHTAIILDGLDEVYSSIPEIITGISEFKEKRPNIQIIISSRDCVSYLDKIRFLGITLLPFTEDQLNRFIVGWLNDEIKSNLLIETITNLKLYEHIKTPLLATITCSLVEKGIKIPSNECEIYTERFKLLTGEYDQYKNIDRQKQKGDLLRRCATTLAFTMQNNNIRATTKADMLKYLKQNLANYFEDELLHSCLDELIDPCNLLIFDRITGTYSFGHFRFQEHLAALELKTNRGIDITGLVKFDWWRGTLGLYAQDTEFTHLFEDVYNNQGNLKKSKTTLEFMISSAPMNKQKHLRFLYEKYLESDYLDSIFTENDNEYPY